MLREAFEPFELAVGKPTPKIETQKPKLKRLKFLPLFAEMD